MKGDKTLVLLAVARSAFILQRPPGTASAKTLPPPASTLTPRRLSTALLFVSLPFHASSCIVHRTTVLQSAPDSGVSPGSGTRSFGNDSPVGIDEWGVCAYRAMCASTHVSMCVYTRAF